MSETAEQIPNPALPEPPVAEVPAQSPELQTSEPDGSEQNEAALIAQITELWRLHTDYSASMRSQSQNLRSLRAELGKKLSEMKQVLARPGRNGQWSGWLKERQIPRATADRLVLKYERSLNPDGNCLSEAICEPTEEEIQSLLAKVLPKLHPALPTPSSAYRFVELIASSFALERRATEEGLVIVNPVQKAAVAEPVQEFQHGPAESSLEPVPVIADVLADGDVQSASTSMAL